MNFRVTITIRLHDPSAGRPQDSGTVENAAEYVHRDSADAMFDAWSETLRDYGNGEVRLVRLSTGATVRRTWMAPHSRPAPKVLPGIVGA